MSREELRRVYASLAGWCARAPEPVRLELVWDGGEPLLLEPDFYWRTLEDQHALLGGADERHNILRTSLTILDEPRLEVLRHGFDEVRVPVELFGGPSVDGSGAQAQKTTLANMDRLSREGIPFECVAGLTRQTRPHLRKLYRFFERAGLGWHLEPPTDEACEGRHAEQGLSEEETAAAFRELADLWLEGREAVAVHPLLEAMREVLGLEPRPPPSVLFIDLYGVGFRFEPPLHELLERPTTSREAAPSRGGEVWPSLLQHLRQRLLGLGVVEGERRHLERLPPGPRGLLLERHAPSAPPATGEDVGARKRRAGASERLRILLLPHQLGAEMSSELQRLRLHASVDVLPIPDAKHLLLAESPGVALEDCLRRAEAAPRGHDVVLAQSTGGFLWRAVFRLAGREEPFALIPHFNHFRVGTSFAMLLSSQFRLPGDLLFAGSQVAAGPCSWFGDTCLPTYPMGVDLRLFRKLPGTRARLKESLGLEAGAATLLFTGRLARDKSVWELLDVVEAVSRLRRVELVLCHANDDPAYARRCEERARRMGNVRLVHNPPPGTLCRYYNAADLFITAAVSTFETFGRSPIEAMACGTPPVVADYDGFREAVTSACGFLVPTLRQGHQKAPDVEGFTRAVLEALGDEAPREDKARRGLERARRFDARSTLPEALLAIRDHLDAHAAAAPPPREPGMRLAGLSEAVRELWGTVEGLPVRALLARFLSSLQVPIPTEGEAVERFRSRWFEHY